MKVLKIKVNLIFILFFSSINAEFLDTLSYYQKFDIALNSYKSGRFKLSQDQFINIIESKKGYEPTSRMMLAYSFYAQKKYDDAENILKKEILRFDDLSYKRHAQVLLSDIYLSRGKFTLAFKNYLQIRPAIKDSVYQSILDEKLILCISNSLKESQLESFLMKENNIKNRSIINLSRAYQSWLNGENYNLKNALDGVDRIYLTEKYLEIYEMLKFFSIKRFTRPITIGVILPLSGNEKQRGLSYLMGLSEYLDNLQNNSLLRFIVYDSKGNSIRTLELVREIQSKSLIRGIIGPMLKEEILVISGFNSSIPILIPNSGPSGLADIAPNIYFLSPSNKTIAERTAQIMINYFGFKNIAVLSPVDNSSKVITDYFLSECNQLGIKPVSVEWYSEKPEDISKQFKSIRKAAWSLVPGEVKNSNSNMDIDSLDALFDVDVTDFFTFTDKDDLMDKKDSNKVVLETIQAFYIPIRKGELTYIGTQFPIYNFKTTVFGNENWLEMDILNEEAIGPHVQGMKVISSLSSELLANNYNIAINYFSLAIDHASFLESIIIEHKGHKKNRNINLKLSNTFIGNNTSILFQGRNKNMNGAVQVLEFKKGLNRSGYFDGLNLVKINK